MMLDVIISLKPKWCKLILRGKKTVELRKSRPKIEPPFRIYLYETKAGRGQVVGECICYIIEKTEHHFYSPTLTAGSLMSDNAIDDYAKGKPVYGWYLAKVTEYKKARQLSVLGLQRAPQSWCYVKEGGENIDT